MTNAPAAKESPANEGFSRGAESIANDSPNTRAPRAQTLPPSLLNPESHSPALLVRWLTRHALLSEAHAGVVADLAFRSREAVHG